MISIYQHTRDVNRLRTELERQWFHLNGLTEAYNKTFAENIRLQNLNNQFGPILHKLDVIQAENSELHKRNLSLSKKMTLNESSKRTSQKTESIGKTIRKESREVN